MLSQTDLAKKLHRLKHYSYISYCYQTANNNHVVILRERPTSLQHFHKQLLDVPFVVQELDGAIIGKPLSRPILPFKLETL